MISTVARMQAIRRRSTQAALTAIPVLLAGLLLFAVVLMSGEDSGECVVLMSGEDGSECVVAVIGVGGVVMMVFGGQVELLP